MAFTGHTQCDQSHVLLKRTDALPRGRCGVRARCRKLREVLNAEVSLAPGFQGTP